MRKVIEGSYIYKSKNWMLTENYERFLENQKIIYGNYIVKMKEDAGLEDEVEKVNALPLHLGAFVLSKSERIMNTFIHAINVFFQMMFIIQTAIHCTLKIQVGTN